MSGNINTEANDLRRRAEDRLKELSNEKDSQRLLYELQIHQIELEMQNEELLEANSNVESGLTRYTDLYDFAPVGYFSLSRQGDIHRVNLTGASMLGMERLRLVKKNFETFVTLETRPIFTAFIERAFQTLTIQKCELVLQTETSTKINVQVQAAAHIAGEDCHIAVMDITDQMKAERQETLLNSMVSSFPLAFFLVDNRTDAILYFNQQFCSIWGIEQIEDDIRSGKLKNNDVIPYCIPVLADVAAFAESCKPLQDESNRDVVEDVIPFVDGRSIRRFSTQIRGVNDTYFGRLYVFEDVTDIKKAHQDIIESEARIRTIIDNVPAGIMIIDAETHVIVNVNPAVAKMIGASQEEIVGTICHSHVCTADVGECPVVDLHQQISNRERMLILADGSLKPILKTAVAVDISGRKYVLESLIDISERKKAEDEIRRRDILLQSSADATRILLAERDLTIALSEVLRLLGTSAAVDRAYIFSNVEDPETGMQLVSQKYEWTAECVEPQIDNPDLQNVPYIPYLARWHEELSHNNMIAGPVKDFPEFEKQTLERQNIKSLLVVPILCDDQFWGFIGFDDCHSERVWMQGESAILKAVADSIGIALARNQAEHKLRESVQDLQRSNRDLEQFAYVASHDLQEPLRMISSYVELLSKRYQGQLDDRADRYIQFAVDGASRMWHLINDLLIYSRAGRSEERERVSVDHVLSEAMINLKVRIDETKTSITHDALPNVRGDKTQLVQLLQNMISNAIKFRGQDPPKIHLSAVRGDGEWVFGLRDNGIGIDPQYAERIFVIFQRLHTNTEYPGTGIGLAVCRKIVECHGGRIWVSAEQEQGLTIFFTHPDHGGVDQQ